MIYRALTTLAGPVAGATARIAGPDWRERMVLDAGPAHRPGGVWLHGASVGELNSGRRIVEALGEALGRDLPVVVTANTVTGRAVAAGWGVPARLAPLDLPGAVDRFLDRHRPAVLVTLENEIWPNRAAAARSRGIAQVVAGARMSARSAPATWARRWRGSRPIRRRRGRWAGAHAPCCGTGRGTPGRWSTASSPSRDARGSAALDRDAADHDMLPEGGDP